LAWQQEFIPRDEVRTDLSVTVVPESKALVNSTKAWTRSLAVQAQVTQTERVCPVCGPGEQSRRNTAVGETTTHRNAMNESGFIWWHIRPKIGVRTLELERGDRRSCVLSEKEQTAGNIPGNALRSDFVLAPHWHALALKPTGRFEQNIRYDVCVVCSGLSDDEVHEV
jgi:hypothetical protein